MYRSMRLASLLFVATALGCTAPMEPSSGSASEGIVGGDLGGPDAVVVLQNLRSGGLCTATLIAERVVLTAKHCIQLPFAEGPVEPYQVVLGVGDSANNTSIVLRAASITTTPGPYTEDSRGGLDESLIGSDVAVIVLQMGTSAVEPIPIRRENHESLSGETITAVGYGQIPSGRAGVKYTAMGRITATDARLLYTGPLTCQGDSGGPAITADGEVAGVVSFGAGGCGSGYGAYNAIFPYLDMIDAALIEAGSCLNDGEERCDGADNDCDDLVDETCTAIGGACTNDAECIGTTCRETVAGQICTTACDPLRPALGCDAGFYCARSSGCEGYCVPMAGEGDLPDGADCVRDGDCASLYCTDPGDGRVRCLSPCRGDEGMCLAGEVCAAPAGVCGGCVAAGIVSGARGVGEACGADSECGSASCLEDAGRSYCTRDCEADSECPSGYHCRAAQCVAGPRGELGNRCVVNEDCLEGLFCASQRDSSWCTRQCFDSNPCLAGFDCVEAGGTTICAPALGLVGDECTSDEECVTELCADDGTCTRHCGADAPCAPGFECARTADGATALCVLPGGPTAGGSCAVVGGPRADERASLFFGFVVALLGATLFWRRRRGGQV